MVEIFEPTHEQSVILEELRRMFKRQYNLRCAGSNTTLKTALEVSNGDDLLDKGNILLERALQEATGKLATTFTTDSLQLILQARKEGIPKEEILALALHCFYPFTLAGVLVRLYEAQRLSDDMYEYIRIRLQV